MSFLPVVLAASVAAHGGAASSPGATVTTRYHLSVRSESAIDLSVFGGPSQVTSQSLSAWVVMTLTDSAEGRAIRVVVDSAKSTAVGVGAPPGEQRAPTGASITGFVGPDGKVKNLTASGAADPVLASVQGAVHGLFPRMRPGTKAGDQWVDTTEIANPGEGNNTTVTLTTTYTAGDPETVGGLAGVRVNARSVAVITGTLNNPQAGMMEVEGAGSGTGTFVVTGEGRFLGGTVSSSQDLKLKVAMAPAPLPLKVTQTLTVTLVP